MGRWERNRDNRIDALYILTSAARCLTKIRLKGQMYTDSYVDRGQMASILWLRKIFLNVYWKWELVLNERYTRGFVVGLRAKAFFGL